MIFSVCGAGVCQIVALNSGLSHGSTLYFCQLMNSLWTPFCQSSFSDGLGADGQRANRCGVVVANGEVA